MKYHGSCHCGNVAIDVETEITGAVSCNCSICSKSAALLAFAPRDAMTVIAAPDAMTTYTFNKHVIQHKFCKTCGIKVFGEGVDPKGNKMAAVNVRCLEGFELGNVERTLVDGKSF